jgi:hypothetical protein
MSLKLNTAEARKADKMTSVIRETGKYVGVITRAEKLVSKNGTKGVGFSFKADDGSTANYLDVYTEKATGEPLWGANLVQAILCCTKTKDATDGRITVEKWDREVSEMIKADVPGYPELMGKRIGLVLQKEIQSHYQTGADQERINIARVFEADTGFTSTEILDKATKPEKLAEFMKTLAPIRDSRKKVAASVQPLQPAGTAGTKDADPFDDDIPF